jgi:nucleotide-binding universal stress UspA family protein
MKSCAKEDTMKILTVFDGSLNSQVALKYCIGKIRQSGGKLIVLHVFPSHLFIDYGAGPKAEEMARRESDRFVADARRILGEGDSGIWSHIITREGDPGEEIITCAAEQQVELIVAPPKYRSLAKGAPCPVSIVPGKILFPVDNTGSSPSVLGRVIEEARASQSEVILLGLVPIHLYSGSEQKEVERIRKETASTVAKLKRQLKQQNIITEDMLRPGYPDEEILRVAERNPITMIVIAESGDQPSELGKAASVIAEDQHGFKQPIVTMSA